MQTNISFNSRNIILVMILFLLTSTTPVSAETVTFTYDELNRLTSATYSSGRISYSYDSAGNMTRVATQFKPTGVCENWESGSIDESAWQKVGSPSPRISSNGLNGGYALDVNGDHYCYSAVYTKREFYIYNGIAAEFALKGYPTSSSTGMGIKAGFTGDLHYGTACNPSTEPPGYFNAIAGVYLDPQQGREKVQYYTYDGQSHEAPYPGDDWHLYRIEIAQSGIVTFYRDGNPAYTTPNAIDLSPYPFSRFQLKGRAVVGEMLADDICIGDSHNQDRDLDGLPDDLENATCTLFDNADTDSDTLWDGIEDSNLDGQLDPNETDPCNPDSDFDGMPDGWEVAKNTNPLIDDALDDNDNDGFSNLREYLSNSDPWDDHDVPTLLSDFNTNHAVDGSDLAIFTEEFGRIDCSAVDPCDCDLNFDGSIDDIDLFLFSEDYGRIE